MATNSQTYHKMLDQWATKWKHDNLSTRIRKLITQANYDLYYGSSGMTGKYPGFTTATALIQQALTHLPSNLYISEEADEVSEDEPQNEICPQCDGQCYLADHTKCDNCNGQGYFQNLYMWWHVEHAEIRQVIVGKELSEYVR